MISKAVVRWMMAVALLSPLVVKGDEDTGFQKRERVNERESPQPSDRVEARPLREEVWNPRGGCSVFETPLTCREGAPSATPDNVWTFVPVDGTVCGKPGTTAGFFVNPIAWSRKLFILLAGGGACFQQGDCRARALNGFDPIQVVNSLAQLAVFDRTNHANPFKDFSYVWVPYCTGDFHSGANVAPYGIQHMGYTNIGKYLEDIVPAFSHVEHVVLAGNSAGGYGATFNYDRVHRAFGSRRVDLVADSGPYLGPPYMSADMQAALDENWGFRHNMPAGCSGCTTSWHELYAYVSAAWPNDRMSLLSSLRDESVRSRFALYGPLDTLDDYSVAMKDLAEATIAPLPNFQVFYVPQEGHGWLSAWQTVVDGVGLEQFLRQQLGDDPAWTSVRPPRDNDDRTSFSQPGRPARTGWADPHPWPTPKWPTRKDSRRLRDR